MKKHIFLSSNSGFVLFSIMAFAVVVLVISGTYLAMIISEANISRRHDDSLKALYLAEAGIQKARLDIKNGNIPPTQTYFLRGSQPAQNNLEDIPVAITVSSSLLTYEIISSCTVGGSERILHATVATGAPSEPFNYAYFINNWGWFYGRGITANGDVRSSGRFDARYRPTVNGDIYAGGVIDDHGDGINGIGGLPEHQHPFSKRLKMPSLSDLTPYQDLAIQKNGTVSIGANVLISNVFGDDPGESGNIVLIGTDANPLVIDGPVVATGDVVIKGTVTGQGAIYAGRNIYLAQNIIYAYPPATPRPPGTPPLDLEVINQWVEENGDRDLVGLAARENIILGDYTKPTEWKAQNYLFDMGDEDVGQDGIADTGDEGEEDGVFEPIYEDLDGDGVWDRDYSWTDVQTQAPISEFENVPFGTTTFSQIANNFTNKLECITFTNHAFAGRTGLNFLINGSIISKDESIIFRNTLTINYDERIHRRNLLSSNPPPNITLPDPTDVSVLSWWEETPSQGE